MNLRPYLYSCILLCSTLLLSCGRDYTDDLSLTDASVGQLVSFSSIVTEQDLSQARSICDSFRSKRLKAIGAQMETNFSFLLSEVNCLSEEVSAQTDAKLTIQSGGRLSINGSSETLYLTDVQTDTNGQLLSVCNSIANNEDVELVTYPDSGVASAISFTSNGYVVSLGVEDSDQKYRLSQKQTFTVSLVKSSAYYGMITSYKSEGLCSNSSSKFIKTQTLR